MDSFKENAYNHIKEQIITGKLSPGEVIDQNVLMDELNISRTPIRDAITALERENLVAVMPRRGVLVANITPNDIANIYFTRELVEPAIAHAATELVDAEKMRQFKRDFMARENDSNTICWNDYSFHKYLVDVLRNPYLSSMMEMILSHNLRFVLMGSKLPNRLALSDSEHIDIIGAMLGRDAHTAEKQMRYHIAQAKASAFQSMQFPLPANGDRQIYQDDIHSTV